MGACIGGRAAGLILLSLTVCVCLLLHEEARITVEVRFSPDSSTIKHTAAQVQPARLCNRIDLGPKYVNETQGPYNPAAVKHPITGEWHLFFTMDEIWFGISNYTRDGTYLQGRMRSHPLLASMGKRPVPASQAQGAVSMLDLDDGYMQKARAEGSDIYKAADWRPFIWKDQIFLGHWVGYLPAKERMAISVLNVERGRTELVHRFSSLSREIEDSVWPESLLPKLSQSLRRTLLPAKPKPGAQPAFRREKNWGFIEENGVLLITYALLPCTVVLEFNPAQPEDLRIRARHCYVADAPALWENADAPSILLHVRTRFSPMPYFPQLEIWGGGLQREIILMTVGWLDILNAAMHISGNPVPFDIHGGDAHQEYLVLLHTKAPEYVNWAVRMDRATKRITHVSAGPILRNQDYRNEGFLQTAMVVSSFHVLPKEGGGQTPADTFVRIFYGEGDRYGCWLDIDVRSIVWHRLKPSTESSPDASRASDRAAASSGSEHLAIAQSDLAPV